MKCNRCRERAAQYFGLCSACFNGFYPLGAKGEETETHPPQMCRQCGQAERTDPSQFCSAACAADYSHALIEGRNSARARRENAETLADLDRRLERRLEELTGPRPRMTIAEALSEQDAIYAADCQEVEARTTEWSRDILDSPLHLAKCPIYLQSWFDQPSPEEL
jgi:hypothetical protein